MIRESEDMKKLRNRQIFEEIKMVALKIDGNEVEDDTEEETDYEKLIRDVFGDE